MPRPDRRLENGRLAIHRHPLAVRLWHWLNLACLLALLTSGLQIFNAHPALYMGKASAFDRPVMAMTAVETSTGGYRGVTRLFGRSWDTTGLFGASREGADMADRGFPRWITLPPGRDLATGRRWHFFFAWIFVLNGAAYLVWGLGGRTRRELWPSGAEIRGIGRQVWDHLRLRLPKGEAARRYNVLQKLSYLAVLLVLLPLMVLTGLTMSPGMDAAAPWLPVLFGGRQTARSIHFLTASGVVLFTLVHVAMVFAAGVINEMRSMITGRYVIDPREGSAEERP
ncbi:MAG TPA: cytochrome b/b6 domain-containing protein [Caulobacteraceae bacterium]|jgi:thiosulfate reductase cytochrome b subunit|nr:cytochrome b/b6 domain-containing protein [Caulobacteraceae bacterium]